MSSELDKRYSKMCARYPQDCEDEDYPCVYMNSRGREACTWKPETDKWCMFGNRVFYIMATFLALGVLYLTLLKLLCGA